MIRVGRVAGQDGVPSERRRSRWYRSREQAIVILVAGIVFGPLIAIVGSTSPDPTRPFSVWHQLIGYLVGACMLIACVRCASCGARVHGGSLQIRNPMKTIAVPLNEIVRLSIGRWGLAPSCGLVRTAARSYHIFGIQSPNRMFRPRNRSAERKLLELAQAIWPELPDAPDGSPPDLPLQGGSGG